MWCVWFVCVNSVLHLRVFWESSKSITRNESCNQLRKHKRQSKQYAGRALPEEGFCADRENDTDACDAHLQVDKRTQSI